MGWGKKGKAPKAPAAKFKQILISPIRPDKYENEASFSEIDRRY